jgi:hypothetical protein
MKTTSIDFHSTMKAIKQRFPFNNENHKQWLPFNNESNIALSTVY